MVKNRLKTTNHPLYDWHTVHFDLQSNLIGRTSVVLVTNSKRPSAITKSSIWICNFYRKIPFECKKTWKANKSSLAVRILYCSPLHAHKNCEKLLTHIRFACLRCSLRWKWVSALDIVVLLQSTPLPCSASHENCDKKLKKMWMQRLNSSRRDCASR